MHNSLLVDLALIFDGALYLVRVCNRRSTGRAAHDHDPEPLNEHVALCEQRRRWRRRSPSQWKWGRRRRRRGRERYEEEPCHHYRQSKVEAIYSAAISFDDFVGRGTDSDSPVRLNTRASPVSVALNVSRATTIDAQRGNGRSSALQNRRLGDGAAGPHPSFSAEGQEAFAADDGSD